MRNPKSVIEQRGASENPAVDPAVRDDGALLRGRTCVLAELLSRITDDNLHSELDTGEPQGNEQW